MTHLGAFLRRYGHWLVALALISYWVCSELLLPTPFYAHYDPEIAYLLSALEPFKGHTYAYIDHPGTPVEMLGTLLLLPAYLAARWQSQPFIPFVLAQPGVFLGVARAFLTLMSALCAALLFRRADGGRAGADLAAALAVALVYFAVHPGSFLSLALWTHNSFTFPFGSLLLLGLLVVARSARPRSWKLLAAFGFGSGVLTAAQLYFATWVIGVGVTFVCLNILEQRSRRQIVATGLTVGVTALLGFGAATAPIWPYYPEFITYVGELIFHQDRFGGGAVGITSVGSLVMNLLRLAYRQPVVFLTSGALVATVGGLLVARRRTLADQPGLWAVAIGLSVQVVATLGLILKHPGEPYLLAVAAIIPVLLAVVLKLFESARLSRRTLNGAVCVLVLAGCAYNYVGAVRAQSQLQQSLAAAAAEVVHQLALAASAAHKPPEALVVWETYGTPSLCYALLFGNYFARHEFGPEIAPLCPGQLNFDIWKRTVFGPDGPVPPTDVHWDLLVVNSKVFAEPAYAYLADYGTVISGESGLVFILPANN